MKNFIEFRNIDFCYDNNIKIFDNFSLTITRGEKIGIVGHSGAGKSTLINLLLKNFAISNYQYWDREVNINNYNNDVGGDIFVNSQSIYDVTSSSIRKAIALIPQDTMLFHRSIGDNIAYGKIAEIADDDDNNLDNINLEEVIEAAKKAQIHNFIASLPNGYDSLVGERGVKLSGGQRQRIAIARAILKDSPILILDEATSSLDSQTENEISQALSAILLNKNTTVIAIAHRLSTLRNLDRIIVLDNGKIAETGNHHQLLQIENGIYSQLWNAQINGFITE
jgi:ATP-binding cassette subfamily B protein